MRKKKTFRVLTLVLALLLSAGAVVGLLAIIKKSVSGFSIAVGDWPMEGKDPSQTAYLETAPQAPLREAWNVRLQQTLSAAPAVAGGRLFVGGGEGILYCLEAGSGLPIWEFDAKSEIASTPCVTGDAVFFGTGGGRVYALDLKGREIWQRELGAEVVAAPVADKGRVYVGSRDKSVYCFEADTGNTVWRYETGGMLELSPCVADGHVFCLSRDSVLYALKQTTGELDWSSQTEEFFIAPCASDAGRVFAVSEETLYCLDTQTGREVWKAQQEAVFRSSLSLRGNIVVVALGKTMEQSMVLDAYNIKTGDMVWEASTKYADWTRLASSNRDVYAAMPDGIFSYSIDGGMTSMELSQSGILPQTLTVTADAIYVATENFKLYCFRHP